MNASDYPAAFLACKICDVPAGQMCWELRGYLMTEDGLIDVSRTSPYAHSSRKISTPRTPRLAPAKKPAAKTTAKPPAPQRRRTAQQQAQINAWTRLAQRKRP